MTNKELIEENKRLEAWIDDLQSGMWINCVYCGHRYGPNKGNHLVTMRKALETHIAECPKHPLAMARNRIKELEAENKRLREALKYIAFTTPGPTMKTHSEAAEQAMKEASHE